MITRVIEEMKEIFKEIPFGVEHTLKVLKNAESISEGENIDADQRELIAIVAVLHDIGVLEAKRKYGSWDAPYQEKEGPIVARQILAKVGYDPAKTDRVCFIIGHHHTPAKIDGLDFQIQWEADLLENLVSVDKNDREKLKNMIEENFKTVTGKTMASNRYLID